MPSASLKEQLREHNEELEEHLGAVPGRIDAYYSEQDPPEGFPELAEPPHQTLIRRAVSTIEFAFEYEQENRIVDLSTEWGTRDVAFSHVGIGLELLLDGIYLKTNPSEFIDKLQKGGKTPDHSTVKAQVMGSLPDSLDSDQRDQIALVIEIVRKQRNNAVHFGFHGFHQAGMMVPYYKVCAYLIAHFSEEQFEIIDRIDADRKAQREGPTISVRPPEDPLPLDNL